MSSRDQEDRLSLISAVGYSASTCGYCSTPDTRSVSPKSSKSYGIWAHHLTPHAYQRLIDQGWRRSGSYIYHPDNANTCCPQHPIRLHAASFRPSRSQKRALAQFKSQAAPLKPGFVDAARIRGKHSVPWDLQRELDACLAASSSAPSFASQAELHRQRAKAAQQWRKERKSNPSMVPDTQNPLLRPLHLMPASSTASRLSVALRPASSTQEKYQLFRRYQSKIHKESEAKISEREGWERFLCSAPLDVELPDEEVDVDSEERVGYGLYHMEYRLDGKLICVGVLDVLPLCTSSVYLYYDPDHADLQLGKVSALFEIALTEQLRKKQGMEQMAWYYMGFYIHNCEKMLYKATFKPSQLLDVLSNTWISKDDVVSSRLDNGARYGFASAATCVEDAALRTLHQNAGDQASSSKQTAAAAKPDALAQQSSSQNDDSDDEEEEEDPPVPFPQHPPPGFLDPRTLDPQVLGMTLVLDGKAQSMGVCPLMMSKAVKRTEAVKSTRECVAALRDTEGFVLVV